jgi:hypothetical protein
MSVILELFNDALRTSAIILSFEERYKNIGYQVCVVLSRTISGAEQLQKYLRKSSWWIFYAGVRPCHELKTSATMNNFSFAKNKWPQKPQMFYTTDFYHMNQARTRPGYEHYIKKGPSVLLKRIRTCMCEHNAM